MLVTRPFLLCSLLRVNRLSDVRKRQYIDELARKCVSAAQASIEIFEDMVRESVVSSLVMMDFFFALQVVQVILAAAAVYCPETYKGEAKRCIAILRAIATSGYPKHLLPETLFQLQRAGVFDDALFPRELRDGLHTSIDGSLQRYTRCLTSPDTTFRSPRGNTDT